MHLIQPPIHRFGPMLLAAALILIGSACDDSSPTGPDLSLVGGGVRFDVRETFIPGLVPSPLPPFGEGLAKIQLHLRTRDTFREGATVVFGIETTEDRIRIELRAVHASDPTGVDREPAVGAALLEIDTGTYRLEIAYDGTEDVYELVVAPDRFTLFGNPGRISEPAVSIYHRMVPNTIALTCLAEAEGGGACGEIMQAWETRGLVPFGYPVDGDNYWTVRAAAGEAVMPTAWYRYEHSSAFHLARSDFFQIAYAHPELTTPACLVMMSWEGVIESFP